MSVYKRTDSNGVDKYRRIEDVKSIDVSTINGTEGRVSITFDDTDGYIVDFGTRAAADAYATNFAETIGSVTVD